MADYRYPAPPPGPYPAQKYTRPNLPTPNSSNENSMSNVGNNVYRVQMGIPMGVSLPSINNTSLPSTNTPYTYNAQQYQQTAAKPSQRKACGYTVGNYELMKTLGSGAFSKVKLAREAIPDRTDPNGVRFEFWAVKIIEKAKLSAEHMDDQFLREISLLIEVSRHPNVVQIKEILQSRKRFFVVQECVSGGELYDRIVSHGRFDENQARYFFQQLISGMYFVHSKGIAHRDLKPENILLKRNTEGGNGYDNDHYSNFTLKISDFGLSNRQESFSMLRTTCGTPSYVAPEVIREHGYNGIIADVWSCGVILFAMVAGYLPFDCPNVNQMLMRIERGTYRIPNWISPELTHLLKGILVVNPHRRMTLENIINDPWFSVGFKRETLDIAKYF